MNTNLTIQAKGPDGSPFKSRLRRQIKAYHAGERRNPETTSRRGISAAELLPPPGQPERRTTRRPPGMLGRRRVAS